MTSFRFIHISDLHIGCPFIGLKQVPQAIFEKIRQSSYQAFDRFVQLAISEQVDFVVISGDVYELLDRTLHSQLYFQRGLKRLDEHQIQTFIIRGNHDPEDSAHAVLTYPPSVHLFSAEGADCYDVHDQHRKPIARIVGMSYATAAIQHSLIPNYEEALRSSESSALFTIAMLHTNLDGGTAHSNYAPATKSELLRLPVDYWALGHVHTRSIIHQHPHIVYSGNTQGRSFQELGERGCYVVDVREGKVESLAFHALNPVQFMVMTISIQSLSSEQMLIDHIVSELLQMMEGDSQRLFFVRIHLEGRGEIHGQLQTIEQREDFLYSLREEIKQSIQFEEQCWISQIEWRTSDVWDEQEWLQSQSFPGELIREIVSIEQDEAALEELIELALRPLRGHSTIRKELRMLSKEEQQRLLAEVKQMMVDLLIEGERSS